MSLASLSVEAQGRMVAAGERRVRRARACPAAPDGAWALRQAMEDALRCASFDDAGRLVLVRRLRIVHLPAGAGGVLLTRALEQAWRETARQAVPALAGADAATAVEAVRAAAVWFASPAEAVLAALVRSVEGVPMDAWFWSLAVPMVSAMHDPVQQVPALVLQLQALAPRTWPQALAGWPLPRRLLLQALLAAAGAEPLQVALVDVPTALAPAMATHPQVQPQAGARQGSPVRAEPTLLSPAEVVAQPGTAQALVPAQSVGTVPPAPAAPSVPAAPVAASPPAPVHGSATELSSAVTVRAGPTSPALFATGGMRGTPQPAAVSPVAAVPATLLPQQSAAPTPQWAASRVPASSVFPWLRDAAFSPHAGALWLVPLMERVGFGAAQPSWGLVHAVLGSLFHTAGLHSDDPQWALLVQDEVPPPEPLARRWCIQARRALRRRAGLSVAELACRPGWVTCTLTHADIVLPLDAVDLRARRLGLDCDPGYVPWLGRILRFHFVARADWPAPEPADV